MVDGVEEKKWHLYYFDSVGSNYESEPIKSILTRKSDHTNYNVFLEHCPKFHCFKGGGGV